MRTFIAIKFEPEAQLLQSIAGLKQAMKDEPIKWVNEQKLHLTLKFLGETSEAQVSQIQSILEQLATQCRPLSFLPSGMGFFKSRGMPRVLFVDIREDDSLKRLAAAIDILVSPLGFETESRPFNPHLTLARIKYIRHKKAFYEAVGHYQNMKLQPVTIDEIIFYQSKLNPDGPVYNELAKFTLKGNS